MDIHPWTEYELAQAGDEERLLRAQQREVGVLARAPGATGGL